MWFMQLVCPVQMGIHALKHGFIVLLVVKNSTEFKCSKQMQHRRLLCWSKHQVDQIHDRGSSPVKVQTEMNCTFRSCRDVVQRSFYPRDSRGDAQGSWCMLEFQTHHYYRRYSQDKSRRPDHNPLCIGCKLFRGHCSSDTCLHTLGDKVRWKPVDWSWSHQNLNQ